MTRLLAPVVLAVVAAAGLTAQQEGQLAQLSSQVQLVEVYATVTSANAEPLTVALGVDRSWSMAGDPLRLAKQTSQAFLRALKPSDRSMVVAISSDAEMIASPSELALA